MQVQTTTVTTETMSVENNQFQITNFEEAVTAFCDCCPNQATGTKDELARRGWWVGQNEQFCGECNF